MVSQAGMTVITLRDVAEARIQSISFFIFIYLILAWAVKRLWNYLAKSFEWMPVINFGKALCLMLVSGLFLYVILTMISGARELMTPGAWEKKGIGYQLQNDAVKDKKRQQSLADLREALWLHANAHDGVFPHNLHSLGAKQSPPKNYQFRYIAGRKIDDENSILAYEPFSTSKKRFVLYADGSIEARTEIEIKRAIRKEKDDR